MFEKFVIFGTGPKRQSSAEFFYPLPAESWSLLAQRCTDSSKFGRLVELDKGGNPMYPNKFRNEKANKATALFLQHLFGELKEHMLFNSVEFLRVQESQVNLEIKIPKEE